MWLAGLKAPTIELVCVCGFFVRANCNGFFSPSTFDLLPTHNTTQFYLSCSLSVIKLNYSRVFHRLVSSGGGD